MDEKALFAISCGLYVIGVKGERWFGGCIVDALVQATAVPPSILLCCGSRSYTHKSIEQHGTFTVSVVPQDVAPLTIANFGFVSARTVDKWAAVEHTLFHGLPVLQAVAARYFCRVIFTRDLGSHTLFHCEVADAQMGSGEALTYGHYREAMKDATVKAFQNWKGRRA